LAFKDTDLAVHQKMVDQVNAQQTTWTASADQGVFFKGMTMKQAKGLMGAKWMSADVLHKKNIAHISALPDNFNSATKWSNCPTILSIRDQSACGSCWAFGAVEAMSDRYCTILGSSNPKYQNLPISAADLMSCCDSCGSGCGGGFPSAAWDYWVQTGLPSEACDPYPFPKCEHHISGGSYPPCPKNEYPTPACNTTCNDGSSMTQYYGTSSYGVSGEQDMMQEIYDKGPIEVAFTVYEDFLTYKSGVYRHVSGQMLGGHAVKAIGWGVTSTGTKYWIINNSWNKDWGNNGQFWILRGVDECGIESQGAAGMPKPF
jgi:C1A family cysteine protease